MGVQRVKLDRQQEEVIEALVRSGRYDSASEVIGEGLRLVAEREAAEQPKRDALREAVRLGFDAIDAGRARAFDSMDDLERYLRGLSDRIIDAPPAS